jgi:hypothetical protein
MMIKLTLITGVFLLAVTWVSYFDAANARCARGTQSAGPCPNGAYAPSAPRAQGQKPSSTQYNR